MSLITSQCKTLAGPLAHETYSNAVATFFIMSFLSFSLGIWLVTLAKGIPIRTEAQQQSQAYHTSGDGQLHSHPHAGQLQRLPTYLRKRDPISGSRMSKAWKAGVALGALVACHVMMFFCLGNITYCPRPVKSSIITIVAVNLLRVLALCSIVWATIPMTCFVKLILEAILIDEESADDELDLDVFAVPAWMLSNVYVASTAPVYWLVDGSVRP